MGAPAEVLPESPAQSVGSNGANHLQEQQVTSETQVKPAKIKKSRKKSAKHQEAPTVIGPSLDQTPIPLLEHITPDLSKAKARKSRSPKKKSAPIQDISTQPLASNGANSLQEHQVTSETQVMPAKIKKSRKKSAKHQEAPAEVLLESPAQPVGSNGVKPAKIKKSRKKSAKLQEAPAEVLLSPAQSVYQQNQVPQTSTSSVIQSKKIRKPRRKSKTKQASEPLTSLPSSTLLEFDSLNPQQEREVEKPSKASESINKKLLKNGKKSRKAQQAQEVLLPETSAELPKGKPRRIKKDKKKAAKPEKPLEGEVPQIQTVPKKAKKPRKSAKNKDQANNIDQPCSVESQQDLSKASKILLPFESQQVQKPEVLPEAPIKFLKAEKILDKPEQPYEKVVREPEALFDESFDRSDESILHQVDQVIQQELVYHDVIKPYQVAEKEPEKYFDYDYSDDDDVVEPELQVPSALFEYKSDASENEFEEDEVIITRLPVSRPTFTYSRISRYEDFESGFKSPVSPCQAQSLDPFEFTDDELPENAWTPMKSPKSPMKSPFRNFCAVNASIVSNLADVKDEFASDDIMDTVENIEPLIVPPLVIKTNCFSLQRKRLVVLV